MSAKVINLDKRLGRLVEARPLKKREVRHIIFKPYEGETLESVFKEKYGETVDAFKARIKKQDPDDDGINLIINTVVRPEDIIWDKEKGAHVYKDPSPQ